MQTSEERLYEAEVYRLRGELLLQQSAAPQGRRKRVFTRPSPSPAASLTSAL
jgi:hypothetical protein